MIIVFSGPAGSGKDTAGDMLVRHHGFVKIAIADEVKRICMRLWDFSEEQLWGDLKDEPDKRYPLGYWLSCGCLADRYELNAKGRIIEPGWWVANILRLCSEHEEHWHRGHCIYEEPVEAYLTPRYAMQKVGTEGARAADPDVWLRIALRVAHQLLEEETTLVYERTKGLVHPEFMRGVPRGVAITDGRFLNELDGVGADGGKTVRLIGRAYEWTKTSQHASEAEQREIPNEYFDYLIYNTGTLDFFRLLTDRMMDVFKGRILEYDEAQADIPPALRR